MASGSQILVGMAEIKICRAPQNLVCLGLGSCIGLLAFDPQAQVAAMAHIMLPAAFKDKEIDKPGKFADSGIPALLELLDQEGAVRSRLLWAYTGGAQVFKYGAAPTNNLDVGRRNTEAVTQHLATLRARVVASDTGGSNGRTMTFDPNSCEVRVRSVAGGERTLCVLGRAGARAA